MDTVADAPTLAACWLCPRGAYVLIRTPVGLPVTIASALLMACPTLVAADARSACELLSESEISTIAGEAVHATPKEVMRADSHRPTCKFVGQRTTVLVSLIQTESQGAAAQEFTHELRGAPSSAQSDEPLRGVGVEARYRPSAGGGGGTIVARFGTAVVVLSGNLDRAALVQLARAAAAHLLAASHTSVATSQRSDMRGSR